ncbi:heat shock protein HtpX [Elusimicrobium simillimum]|uniref:M48 family metallopeptidase n=1 Tax=Elusimicrobium simillimum TaxID=3143438 RepID=UPI003C6EAADB
MRTSYDHIDENKKRTILIILLFPLSLTVLVGITLFLLYFFQYSGTEVTTVQMVQATASTAMYVMPAIAVLAILWVVISYFTGDKLLLNSADAIEIDRRSQPEIFNMVDTLCIAAGLPTPRVYLIEDNSLNAFATGRDPEHASIALTTGIVKVLNRQELEGVIAHELCHVQNRDIRLMLITVAGISFFTLAGQIVLRMASRSKKKEGLIFLVLGLVLMIYGYFVAPLIRLALSRRREFQADATAALLTRNPRGLASALEKISGNSKVESLKKMDAMASMCIESPLERDGLFSSLSGLTATHPPIAERIAALNEMDGRI